MTKNKINGSCICSTGTVWSFQNILRNSRGNGSCQGMSGMFMSTPLILGSSLQSGRKQAVSFPIAMQPLVSIWNYFFSARLRPDKITFASIEIGCFPMFLHLRTFSCIAHFCQPSPPPPPRRCDVRCDGGWRQPQRKGSKGEPVKWAVTSGKP